MKQLLLILLLVLAACAVQPRLPAGEIPCTLDARICPDGSAVGRNGTNNCEFDPCPIVKKKCPLDTKECANNVVVSRNPDKSCEFDECPFQIEQNFVATYKDGRVDYFAKVIKPTPCYSYNVTQQIVNTTPLQIKIDLATIPPPKNTFCAQVESEEMIQGYVLVDTKPSSLTVYKDGIVLYSEKKFE